MKEGWKYKKLKDIGLTQTGTTPAKSDKSNYGEYMPFIRPAELNVDENGAINYDSELKLSESGIKNSRLIKEGSILMCCIGSVGKTGFSTRDVTCNQQINTLTPSKEHNAKFIYYALLSPNFQQEIWKIANSAKATLAIISKGKWENLSVPVSPLSEQQEIVTYLDSAFEKIDRIKENAEKSLSDAKALFQSALKEMMQPKDGWEEKTLGELAIDMYRGAGIKRDQVTEEGIPCVRYGEIYTTYNYAFHDCKSHTTEDVVSSPKYFEHGDLLFAITGESVEDIGKTIAYIGNEKCMCGGDIVVMKHQQNPRFMAYVLSAPEAIRQKGFGKTKLKVVHTNVPSLQAISIPVPPLEEQEIIASTLDALSEKVSALEANYTKTIAECNALKQALLKQVFE